MAQIATAMIATAMVCVRVSVCDTRMHTHTHI